jgi:hypothetical protein
MIENHFGWRGNIRRLYVGNPLENESDSKMVHSEE